MEIPEYTVETLKWIIKSPSMNDNIKKKAGKILSEIDKGLPLEESHL